jgi:hypothetical protein
MLTLKSRIWTISSPKVLSQSPPIVKSQGSLFERVITWIIKNACSIESRLFTSERVMPKKQPEKGEVEKDRVRVVYQGFLSNNGGHYDLMDIFALFMIMALS